MKLHFSSVHSLNRIVAGAVLVTVALTHPTIAQAFTVFEPLSDLEIVASGRPVGNRTKQNRALNHSPLKQPVSQQVETPPRDQDTSGGSR